MEELTWFEIYKHVLVVDFLRYFIAASLAYLIFWIIFIKSWRHRIIQKKFPLKEKMWFEFKYSMSTVFIFSLIGFGIFSAIRGGYTQNYKDFAAYGWAWFVASFVIMVLMHDTYFYWTHRAMHHPKIFKKVHLVHHNSTNPSPWAAYSFHPIEAVVEAGIVVLIVFTVPFHGLALASFLIYMITRNVIGHLGIEMMPSGFVKIPFLNWHTTTIHHDLHHKFSSSNYGLYFVWWDRICGTEDKKYLEKYDEVTSRKKPETVKNGNVQTA